jgi:hypothetical protein
MGRIDLIRKPTYAIFAGAFGGIAPPGSGGHGYPLLWRELFEMEELARFG